MSDESSAPEPVEGAGSADDGLQADGQAAPLVIRRRGRRVSTEPPPGYTGEPALERGESSENDARLQGDVPPHWG
ncbi:hypothetical protein [Agrococcus sp. Ld7]|uniref:hypothetical protein n=1 Tax=Agrococcus sp. Ld7 TaxID=649148 RepID=UPI0038703E98